MSVDVKAASEAYGSAYSMEMMLEARRHTRQAVVDIAALVEPGMAEEAAVEIAKGVLKRSGLFRGWHGLHLRFGRNTLRNFGEPSEPGVVLEQDDIFFIDIGPVWKKWEGDAGDTFVVGGDPEMLAIRRDVRALFGIVRDVWLQEGISGMALYDFAAAEAARMGWDLNLAMSGHRLSDFPHAVHHRGPLAGAAFTPSPGLWVLELQIRHPTRAFGAFYEDILLDGEGEQ